MESHKAAAGANDQRVAEGEQRDAGESTGEDEKPQQGAVADIPRRLKRTVTPLSKRVPTKRYIKFESGGAQIDDFAFGGTASQEGKSDIPDRRRRTVGAQSTDIEAQRILTSETIEGDIGGALDNSLDTQTVNYQRAPEYTQADPGPNLNVKKRAHQLQDRQEFVYDWVLSEAEAVPPHPPSPPQSPPPSFPATPLPMVQAVRPPPPSPSPSPTPPNSVGGSPEPTTPPPTDIFEPPADVTEEKAREYDENIREINESKWRKAELTRWVDPLVVKTTQRAMYKENTEQVKEGLKVLDSVTSNSLNKYAARLVTLIPQAVYAISIISALVNLIVTNGAYAYATVTCFVFDTVELILLILTFFIKKSRWYKNMSEHAQHAFEKKHELIDSVIAECLLFPTIICSVVGFATDKIFLPENFLQPGISNDLSRLDMFLLAFDVCSLSYVYATRIYITRKVMANIEAMFPDVDGEAECCGLTTRIVYTVAFNSLVFGSMMVLLGVQLYKETEESGQPQVSAMAAYMIFASIFIPIVSLIVFALANYYYILEFMIRINVHVIKQKDFRKKISDMGYVGEGILTFASNNVHATPGRLRDIRSLTGFQRVFYVLREWWIDLIFFIWAVVILMYCYVVYVYVASLSEGSTFKIVYICAFMITATIFLYGNFHTFAIVMITNIVIVPLTISFGLQAIINFCKNYINSKSDKVQLLSSEKDVNTLTSRAGTSHGLSAHGLKEQKRPNQHIRATETDSDKDFPQFNRSGASRAASLKSGVPNRAFLYDTGMRKSVSGLSLPGSPDP